MARRTQLIVSGLFLAMLFAPLVAGAFGYQPKAIENREIADFPPLRNMFSDAEFLDHLQRAANDRLPFRAEMVTAGAWVDMSLFKVSYNPLVKIGNDDWLFSTAEIYGGCKDPIGSKVDGIRQFGDMLASHGIRFVSTVAPNKASIFPEKLGTLLRSANKCSIRRRKRTQKLMEEQANAYFVDLWADLLTAKSTAQRPLYLSLDTHWSATGAAIASKAVINHLHPGLWDDAALVVSPPEMVPGNLSRMNGLTFAEPMQFVTTARPGVVVVDVSQLSKGAQDIHRFKATSSGPYLIPGRTIIMHDSFFERTVNLLPAYFEDITFITDHVHEKPEAIDLIANSETFIMALVERTFMGTNWYHKAKYQRAIEKAINHGMASRQ
jgi:acetyltransferase AlgX (SGNH hydrolase-like protein)